MKKKLSFKEKQRRVKQATGSEVLYLDGDGGTFTMTKVSKDGFKVNR